MDISEVRIKASGSDLPVLRDLVIHVIPLTTSKWYELGLQLLDPDRAHVLDTIESDTKNEASTCCRKMFQSWLNSDKEACWNKVIKALLLLGLNIAAGKIKEKLLQDDEHPEIENLESKNAGKLHGTVNNWQMGERMTSDHPSANINRFNGDAIGAFAYVLYKLTELLCIDFGNLKQKFESICQKVPHEFASKLKAAKSSSEFAKVLNLQAYCNWLNVRILKRIVIFSENPTATQLMDAYEKYLYHKKVLDVVPCFKSDYFYDPNHFSSVKVYINNNFQSLIVKDVIKHCENLESEIKIPIQSLSVTGVTCNCVIISCASPLYCLQHMYEMAKKVRFKFRKYHIQYLQIGFFPKVFTTNVSVNKKNLSDFTSNSMNLKLSSSQVISYYYMYLVEHMDADSVSHKMHAEHFITDDDYAVLSCAPTDMKINHVLLQFVKLMNSSSLLKFCKLLKSIETQKHIGNALTNCLQKTFSVSENVLIQDESQLLEQIYLSSEDQWATSLDPSMIHLGFLNVVDQLLLLLSSSDVLTFNLSMTLQGLMASEVHHIPFFSEAMLKSYDSCKSYFLLQILILPYITWLDHSLLRRLVSSSKSMVAKKILDAFDESVDYKQSLSTYPIPAPSQMMIPLDGCDYTLIATKCDFDFENAMLQKVVDIKNVLKDLWEITQHAIQLTAMHIQERYLYWMIPKSVVELIAEKTPQIQYELWRNEITMCSIFPSDFYSCCRVTTVIEPGAFCLLHTEERNEDFLSGKLSDIDYHALSKWSKSLKPISAKRESLLQQNERLQTENRRLQIELDESQQLVKLKTNKLNITTGNFKSLSEEKTMLKEKHNFDASSSNSEDLNDCNNLPDIACLLNIVPFIQNHWYIIGTRLKILDETLNSIWEAACKVEVSSKEVFCCCKMLICWHKQRNNSSVSALLHAVNIPPLLDKLTLISNILLDEDNNFAELNKSSSNVDEAEKQYALMITDVTEIISNSKIDTNKFKQYLDHCKDMQTHERKIDRNVYENALSFSDLIDALESNGYISQVELSWLKHLVADVANNDEALEIIKRYEEMNIVYNLHWQDGKQTSHPHETVLLNYKDSNEQLVQQEDLGSGQYGRVSKFSDYKNIYAGKTIYQSLLPGYPEVTANQLNKFTKEINLFMRNSYSHPNIEHFQTVLQLTPDNPPTLLSELMTENLDMFVIRMKGNCPLHKQLDICHYMVTGLQYLHSFGIMHRNLHGRNVLISQDGRAKIADYICPQILHLPKNKTVLPADIPYLPPEVISDKSPYTEKSDIYSLGVLLLEVATQKIPEATDTTEFSKKSKRQQELSEVRSHPLLFTILGCLNTFTLARPSLDKICDAVEDSKETPMSVMSASVDLMESHQFSLALQSGRYKLKWENCSPMPTAMCMAYVTIINATMYIGGGICPDQDKMGCIHAYKFKDDKWSCLPPLRKQCGVPMNINKKLTIIGGCELAHSSRAMNTLTTFYNNSWNNDIFPNMLTARIWPDVASHHQSHIIVVGGKSDGDVVLNTIEVLDLTTLQWRMVKTCLPQPMFAPYTTICGNSLVIVGFCTTDECRSTKAFLLDIDEIIIKHHLKQTIKDMSDEENHNLSTLTNPPFSKTALIQSSSTPVILGGEDKLGQAVNDIMLYDDAIRDWRRVSSLPISCMYTALAVSNNQIIITGGCKDAQTMQSSMDTSLNSVFIGHLVEI